MYDWSKPITWKEFKSYPHDIQEECLRYFRDKWGCSSGMMSEMFGLKASSLSEAWRRMGLKGLLVHSPKPNDMVRFEAWLHGFQETEEEPEPVEPPVVKEKTILATLNPIFTQSVKKGNLLMSGKGSEIAQTLWGIFQNENVRMMIDFELIED